MQRLTYKYYLTYSIQKMISHSLRDNSKSWKFRYQEQVRQ